MSDTLTFSFTMQEAQVIRAGLMELPIKLGWQTLMKLEQQLQPYVQQPQGRPNGDFDRRGDGEPHALGPEGAGPRSKGISPD